MMERSISPAPMTNVAAIATSVKMTTWSKRLSRFCPVKKYGLAIVSATARMNAKNADRLARTTLSKKPSERVRTGSRTVVS
jgi:hypothetical protein